jgi:hypothetical protein
VLILHDPFQSNTCPRPSFLGGKFSFIFETPVYFHDLGVFDIDELDSRLEITYSDDVVEFFDFVRFGDNAVQRVIIGKPNVKKLVLAFQWATTAITELSYCRVCEATEGHDESHSCIVAGNVVNKVSEVIELNDFEQPNILDALKGWEHGRIHEGSENEIFTKFLGVYKASDMVVSAPYKVFKVPMDAETIILELDFYEIDDWNQDTMAIYVDGERILMNFTHNQDEGRQMGRTQLGVTWTSVSIDIPKLLGFSSSVLDQKHHISIEVPSTSRLYKDGELRLKLWYGVTNPNSTAVAGWDNIKISERHGCSLLDDPSTRAKMKMTSSETSNPADVSISSTKTISSTNELATETSFFSNWISFQAEQPTELLTNSSSMGIPSNQIIFFQPDNSMIIGEPTSQPTKLRTNPPTSQPTKSPTNQPTKLRTNPPTSQPTKLPTNQPTKLRTNPPTSQPTKSPTNQPTKLRTNPPTSQPTKSPTNQPTKLRTNPPTSRPTKPPTNQPTKLRTNPPTSRPTNILANRPT